MGFLLKILSKINQRVCATNSKLYVSYLRKKGVLVGSGTRFFGAAVDVTRPCLVEIGRNCIIANGVLILTHGGDWIILREEYGQMLGSSGKVVIEDNVFIGTNTIILKGTRIGKNTIIGAGSVVTQEIPSNSVAAGNPCKVIMSIDKFYEKRKREYLQEAKAYAFEIYRKTGKVPTPEWFWEEFPIFLDRHGNWYGLPVREQLGSAMADFLDSKPLYESFEDFLLDSGIPREKIDKHMRSRLLDV
jgi:acetyltransferase-like isoleucine patch superfamily enzyme